MVACLGGKVIAPDQNGPAFHPLGRNRTGLHAPAPTPPDARTTQVSLFRALGKPTSAGRGGWMKHLCKFLSEGCAAAAAVLCFASASIRLKRNSIRPD